MITKEQADVLLNDMGQTAKEVADFLKSQNIKGKLSNAQSCPVANYMISQGGEPDSAIYDRYNGRYDGNAFVIMTPTPVFQFIRDFDGGTYPELVSL